MKEFLMTVVNVLVVIVFIIAAFFFIGLLMGICWRVWDFAFRLL